MSFRIPRKRLWFTFYLNLVLAAVGLWAYSETQNVTLLKTSIALLSLDFVLYLITVRLERSQS